MNGDQLISFEGIAAAIMTANINTDIIAPPGRGGATHDRYGSVRDGAARVFGPWRYEEDSTEQPDFILNKVPFRHAQFLIAGENFGCGSSRETAPMWLRAFGFRCIMAPSFGGIFFDNCFRNGLLPLKVDAKLCARFAEDALSAKVFRLSVSDSQLVAPNGIVIPISLPAFRRALLIDGVDEIETIQANGAAISDYHDEMMQRHPWILPTGGATPW